VFIVFSKQHRSFSMIKEDERKNPGDFYHKVQMMDILSGRFRPHSLSWLLILCFFILMLSCSSNSDKAGATGEDGGSGGSGGSASFKFVMQSIIIPRDAEQYSMDLNNDGKKDNAFIGLNGRIRGGMHQDLEEQFYDMFKNGEPVFLVEAAPSSDKIKIQIHFGEDQDKGNADRFSGSAKFKIKADSPQDLTVTGSFVDGQIKTEAADFQFPLPQGFFGIAKSTLIKVKSAVIVAALAAGKVNGQITGYIPWSDIKEKILPSLAEAFTKGPRRPDGPPPGDAPPQMRGADGGPSAAQQEEFQKRMEERHQKFLTQLDANKDGKLTADEIENSPMLEKTLKADVELKGEKGLSFGFGYSAVMAQW
jgi:hypothetical protein